MSTEQTGNIVATPMVIELILAITFLVYSHGKDFLWALVLLGLVVLVWINTFFWAIPLHNSLSEKGFDVATIQKLIVINGWRTGFWTIRLLLLCMVCYFYIKPS